MSGETILNGRYRLLTQYASGGMAVIYKATDLSLQRTVAVKILRPSLTVDPQFLARFQNEGRAIANLAHPNIVTVHDVGTDVDSLGKTTHYIIMEFVEGQDLKKLIKAQGALPIDRALNIAIQICAGIGFAHRTGIVHADIKPQNILMNRDGMVKITDFGIAQAWSDTQPMQRESVVWGSPHYFSPEQARGEKPTAASDVYSIGIVMFEMLSGRVPYTGSSQHELALAHLREAVPSVTAVNPTVPPEFAMIIQRAMSKEPHDRFRMAGQLGEVLTAYQNKGQNATLNVAPAPTPNVPPAPNVPPVPNTLPQSQAMNAAPPNVVNAPPLPPTTLPQGTTQARPQPNVPSQPIPQPQPQPLTGMPPTQRYQVAPEAPPANPYARPQTPPGQPPTQQPSQGYAPSQQPPSPVYGQPGYGGQPMQPLQTMQPSPSYPQVPTQTLRGDSGVINPQSQYNLRQHDVEELPNILDGVTVALIVLALVAVLGLIVLYVAVFAARGG